MSRVRRISLGVLFLGALFPPAVAAVCGSCTSDGSVSPFLCPGTEEVDTGTGCGGFPSCQTPVLFGPILDFTPEPDGEFTVRLVVEVTAPRNHDQENSAFWPQVYWYAGSTAPPPGSGNACLFGPYDLASTYVQRQNVTCGGGDFGTFSLRAVTCSSCAAPALLTGMRFQVAAGSPPGCGGPPPSKCPDDESCSLCLGPGGSSSPGGGNTFANDLLRGCGIRTILWPSGIPPYSGGKPGGTMLRGVLIH